MNDFKDFFYLGKVIKLHGYEGKLSIYLDTNKPNDYINLDLVHMNIGGSLVPYFIEELSLLNNKAVVRFMDIDTIDKAEELVNKEFYLPMSMLPKLSGNKFYYHEVPGMLVVDENFGEIGAISKVLEYPNTAVLQVFYENKEVLIPISDEIIKKVDRGESKIFVNSPEGLLDIYINDI